MPCRLRRDEQRAGGEDDGHHDQRHARARLRPVLRQPRQPQGLSFSQSFIHAIARPRSECPASQPLHPARSLLHTTPPAHKPTRTPSSTGTTWWTRPWRTAPSSASRRPTSGSSPPSSPTPSPGPPTSSASSTRTTPSARGSPTSWPSRSRSRTWGTAPWASASTRGTWPTCPSASAPASRRWRRSRGRPPSPASRSWRATTSTRRCCTPWPSRATPSTPSAWGRTSSPARRSPRWGACTSWWRSTGSRASSSRTTWARSRCPPARASTASSTTTAVRRAWVCVGRGGSLGRPLV